MMPPHITRTEPPDGGTLTGDTLVLHGYTLSVLSPEDFRLTGEDGQAVAFTLRLHTEREGKGTLPGSVQERARVELTLKSGAGRYRLQVLDEDLHFVVTG